MNSEPRLRITEIFHSLQGESRTVGVPTVFVRLTGCPLRCQYCDTEYAFSGGELMELSAIVKKIREYRCGFVTVTGGEPLAQPECLSLLNRLCDENLQVSLETSGALCVAEVDPRVSIVLDLKTPGSRECHRNLESNIALLQNKDQVKFVICDETDYVWAKARVDQYNLLDRVGETLFSPSFEQLSSKQLAQWILRDGLAVRMQMQLHKYIWGSEPGH